MEIDYVNDEGTLITDQTFLSQGWERNDDEDEGESYYYWTLPLPKDNPDKSAPMLISTTNDGWKESGIDEGTYIVELFDWANLGVCEYEEQIEELYEVLTKRKIYDRVSDEDDNVSEKDDDSSVTLF